MRPVLASLALLGVVLAALLAVLAYPRVYRRLGGRPWTFISRDASRTHPLLFYAGFLAGGLLLGLWLTTGQIVLVSACLGAGVVIGHIWRSVMSPRS